MKGIPTFDVEAVHSFIITSMINKKIMVPYLKKTSSRYYPALIGGVCVTRCAALIPRARKLIGALYSNDIDIKWMIISHVVGLDDEVVGRAHKARWKFLAGLLGDAKMEKVLREAERMVPSEGVKVRLEIKDSTNSEFEGIRKSMRVSMRCVYKWKEGGVDKEFAKDLVDTGVYSDYGKEMYLNYKTYISPGSKLPVPVHTFKGLPFATCEWTYFETVGMLIKFGEGYHAAVEKGDKKEIKLNFLKYLKYLAKFSVLYVMMNKLKSKDATYLKIKELYGDVQKVLASINIKKELEESPQVMTPERNFMKMLLEEMRGRTNMTRLEAAFKNGLKDVQL